MKTLSDIEVLRGVRVLVRADFNVLVRHGQVAEDFRVRAILPTLDFLLKRGAKVTLISHIEASPGEKATLRPVAECLRGLGRDVEFIEDWKNAHEKIENMGDGQCVLLENLRIFEGEKNNDPSFARELASLGDIYVNDGFSVSHRKHASVVGLPKLMESYAGLQMEKEINHLSRSFDPPHPFVFILGGAKFETKLPLIRKFSGNADRVVLVGALANDAYKAKGYEVGRSLTSDNATDINEIISNPKLYIPPDAVNQNGEVKPANRLSKEDKILDAGPETIEELRKIMNGAKFILWNGPLGQYEDGYTGATLELAKIIAEETKKGAMSIVGGGDTLAAIDSIGIGQYFTFESTGGGAMLDFLANGTLPGIEALGH